MKMIFEVYHPETLVRHQLDTEAAGFPIVWAGLMEEGFIVDMDHSTIPDKGLKEVKTEAEAAAKAAAKAEKDADKAEGEA